MNYDQYYDTSDITLDERSMSTFSTSLIVKVMRGTGVEPVSLSAPDPKSHPTPGIAVSTEGASATSRYQTLPGATATTTKSTTCADSSVPRSPASLTHEGTR